MKEVAVEECGFELMSNFTCNSRFTAARDAHQDVDVVFVVGGAHSVAPMDEMLLRVTIIGNIVQRASAISNNH